MKHASTAGGASLKVSESSSLQVQREHDAGDLGAQLLQPQLLRALVQLSASFLVA